MANASAINLFKVLADPTRLELLTLVAHMRRPCGADLARSMGITAPTVSHHMKKLAEVGLVESRRKGKWTSYQVIQQEYDLVAALIEHCERRAETKQHHGGHKSLHGAKQAGQRGTATKASKHAPYLH